ncbi:hypothetical protein [uncultured Flavobacterium sp.]|uniref:hypothetical protein n=1 Tax=uncultured Flavobacterium sp. TaxID=165435 RepID=UPI0030EC4045|tara:strand:+ start:2170 stop:3021 length:852 start_codon:yes stop_codon:yes gene_type:complete
MKFKFLFLVIITVFVSCKKGTNEVDNIAIARVNNSNLYKEDIKGLVPAGTSKKDSIIIVNDYIDRWASQKLLFNAAELNLSDEKQTELNKLVEQYKKDLYTKAYIEQLVYKSFDTIVSENEIKEYYEKNKENFKTNTALVKMSYIQINKSNPKLTSLSNKFVNTSKENKESLKNSTIEFKSYAFNDSIWIDMNQVYEKLPVINVENKENYIIAGKTVKFADSTDMYLIKTSNYIDKNQVSPFQYIKPTLKKVILNKRKTELINKYQKDITTDALKDKKYEIYK